MAGFGDGDVKSRSPNSTISSSVQYFHLEYVTINLYSLLAVAPMLHTLEARFVIPDLELGRSQPRLLYLQRLRIELGSISWIQMTILLSLFPRLTYFTIIANRVNNDMADGYAWARLLQHIEHFEFELEFNSNVFEQQPFNLDSFRTKFWLEEKKWFVTYDRSFSFDECLMHYMSSSSFMTSSTPERIRTIVSESTASEQKSYSNLHSLAVDDTFLKCKLLHQHTGTKELCLSEVNVRLPTTLKDHMTDLNTSQITTCTIYPEWEINLSYEHIEYLHSLPRLCRLKLSSINLNGFFLHQWPHIVDLKIDTAFNPEFHVFSSNDIDAFCHSFTHIERLEIHSSSVPDLAQLLNRMKMTLRQICIRQPCDIDNEQLITREWIKQNINLQNFYYTRNRWNTVYLWL
ncbi:unnamed protein product [Rotaria sordida]|uniref:Uncharacterized protein n=1 Tax=Rotaria sordida TaxID=392033 RepID=A0A819CGL4_9BILA|nr:unnamed protein product [Rotaria sordida]CAF3811749.1 unnamed protein product [Rotaria sordida]